jgi:hypothetical protein
MTVKEATELIETLKQEIDKGIDVEFNTKWIELLRQSIGKAIFKQYKIQ